MPSLDITSVQLTPEDWWTAWRKVDFSWDGLAKKPIEFVDENDNPLTLQDYWRTDLSTASDLTDEEMIKAGILVADPSNRLWHIAHLPSQWSDGSPTWKADLNHKNWHLFWQHIGLRVRVLEKSEFDFAETPEKDKPTAQFAGVVFGEEPEDWGWQGIWDDTIHIRFATCAFLGETNFIIKAPRADLNLRSSLFASRADFSNIEVTKLDLRNGLFCGQVTFDRFAADSVDLAGCTFLRNVSMLKAVIAGDFNCSRSHFLRELSVLNCTIGGKTDFAGSVLHHNSGFEGSNFKGEASFSFSRFEGLTSFASVTFTGRTDFADCGFEGDLTITGKCESDFLFIDCTLESTADFSFLDFTRDCYFTANRFRQEARFNKVRFLKKVSFLNSVFESTATFQDVSFHGVMEFHNTSFGGVADLSKTSFPQEAHFYHSAFRGAEFRRVADFTIPGFSAWGAFAGVRFQQQALFPAEVLRKDDSFHKALACASICVSKKTSAKANIDRQAARESLDHRYGELESAFQTLKLTMANQQARREEQRFYRFELMARSRQVSTPLFERFFSALYHITSSYGTRLAAPLLWLLSLTLLFAVTYWLIAHSHSRSEFWNALTFSARNVIQPFGVWTFSSASTSADQWILALLAQGGQALHLAVRLTATFQSLISTTLLFLAGLAIKRLFEIK